MCCVLSAVGVLCVVCGGSVLCVVWVELCCNVICFGVVE